MAYYINSSTAVGMLNGFCSGSLDNISIHNINARGFVVVVIVTVHYIIYYKLFLCRTANTQ